MKIKNMEQRMREQLAALRDAMSKNNIDMYLINSSDAHQSEYVSKHDKCIEYISGFTGSAATVLVTRNEALLWTDGRYFIQAERELKNSSIKLMRQGENGVPDVAGYIKEYLKAGETLGFFGDYISLEYGSRLKSIVTSKSACIKSDIDLIDIIWKGRPKQTHNKLWILDKTYTGESAEERLKKIKEDILEKECDMLILSALDDIAYISCLRGSDIEYNPLFYSYMIIDKASAKLYISKESIDDNTKKYLKNFKITLCEYESFKADIKAINGKKIWLDKIQASFSIADILEKNNKLIYAPSPAMLQKTIKTQAEIEHMKACHIRDGLYVTRYIMWLKNNHMQSKTEVEVSDYLDALRASDSNFISLSFATISAFGANAAMCHYEATKDNCSYIENDGLYLVDSGAHYKDGTTDVTRTIAIGQAKAEEKIAYTLVTVSMLRLLNARFKEGARGTNLDTYARELLWKHGMNFNHGTGHGVGFCNTVHESPLAIRTSQGIRPELNIEFKPGMIVSNEPGYYKEGAYGIRTENLLLCVKDKTHEGFLGFEALTCVPLDNELIDVKYMTAEDINMYNAYQKQVYDKLNKLLDKEEAEILKRMTKPIEKGN